MLTSNSGRPTSLQQERAWSPLTAPAHASKDMLTHQQYGGYTVEHMATVAQVVNINEAGGAEAKAPEAWRVLLECAGTVHLEKISYTVPRFPSLALTGT